MIIVAAIAASLYGAIGLPPASETSRYAVVGKSGTGKSNAVKAWLEREVKAGRRVVVFDPEDEYSQLGKERPGFVRLGPLVQRCTTEELERDPVGWLGGEKLALAVVPQDDEDEQAQDCETLADFAEAYGGFLLVFDEIGAYAFDQPEAKTAQKALNKVATRGRKWGVPVLFVSQRAVHIPKTARTQITALQTFCQDDPEDLRAIEARVGLTMPELPPRIPHLRKGQSETWCDPLEKSE